MIIFDIWLLASEANIGGFEDFDLTNPRGRFSGERFHLACPKLGLGDAILSHTIIVWFYISAGGFYTSHRNKKEEGHTIGGFQQGGTPLIEGRFDPTKEKRFWEFQVLVFPCRCLSTILGGFRRHFSG
jgi:hypothetical protein